MQDKRNLEIGGISFGLTSGVITTLGLIIGLNTATESKLVIIAGILTIAVADSLSDAFGMQLSEESRLDETTKPIWLISLFTFLGKFFVSLLFVIPFLLFETAFATSLAVGFGILFIVLLAIYIAGRRGEPPMKSVIEHTFFTILVIIASYFAGTIANSWVY